MQIRLRICNRGEAGIGRAIRATRPTDQQTREQSEEKRLSPQRTNREWGQSQDASETGQGNAHQKTPLKLPLQSLKTKAGQVAEPRKLATGVHGNIARRFAKSCVTTPSSQRRSCILQLIRDYRAAGSCQAKSEIPARKATPRGGSVVARLQDRRPRWALPSHRNRTTPRGGFVFCCYSRFKKLRQSQCIEYTTQTDRLYLKGQPPD